MAPAPFDTLETHHYGTILVDPPWHWQARSPRGEGRSAARHYDVMSFTDLCALPVADLAARDCALFLWATDPLLPRAIELIEAWGFVYKTVGFVWVKTNAVDGGFFTGMGFWTRANAELCLLATRGRPQRLAKDVRRLVIAPRREHSRKPDQVRERIERLVPGPRVELFARSSAPCWDSWGDEVELFSPVRDGLHTTLGNQRPHHDCAAASA
jgi:N6-adenosine-specific RNA methylase IME4